MPLNHPTSELVSPRLPLFMIILPGLILMSPWIQDPITESLTTAPRITLPGLFSSSIRSSADPLELSEGHWLFPGMPWIFTQTSLVSQATANTVLEVSPDAAAGERVPLDDHLLDLVKSLMVHEANDGNFCRYSFMSSDLRGTAVSLTEEGREIPVALRISWPAYDDQWTQVEARRIAISAAIPPMLNLPPAGDIMASRVAADGTVICHMVTFHRSAAALPAEFAKEGWAIETPPADSGAQGLFWVSSPSGRFEIIARDTIGAEGSSALVRRI